MQSKPPLIILLLGEQTLFNTADYLFYYIPANFICSIVLPSLLNITSLLHTSDFGSWVSPELSAEAIPFPPLGLNRLSSNI